MNAQHQPSLSFDNARDQAVCALHEATAIYTTRHVVEPLLARTGWPECGGRLLDSSAGDGAFLVAALERLRPAPGDWEAADRVRGYEIHAGAVAQAREHTAAALVGLGWSSADARIAARRIVVEKDFLLSEPTEQFQAIVGNPPYIRMAKVPDYFKELYKPLIRRHAAADLLHAFLDMASLMLTPGGRLAAVTSDRWWANETAAPLRAVLGERLSLVHAARLDSSTAFYRAKTRRKNTLPRCHAVEVVMVRGEGLAISEAPIRAGSDAALDAAAVTLSDIADVRMAPWMGPDGVFVLPAAEAAALGSGAWVPVVDAKDLDPTKTRLQPLGRVGLRSNAKVEPSGALATHLREGVEKIPAGARRAAYWVPPESLPVTGGDVPRLMLPRIAPSIRCIELPAGVEAINHNIVVSARPGYSLERLREILSSPDSQEWLRENAGKLENDFFMITTRLMRRMPIPARFVQPQD